LGIGIDIDWGVGIVIYAVLFKIKNKYFAIKIQIQRE